ncbi:MAG: ABC transporter permease [Planctomycetaceae bacterium]|nr:ABC transporter permease [Planctomycetaceae bacterium]
MLKLAFRNLLSRPMRSLLSLLGLTVAIAGMVGLFSVARGLDAMISDTFNDIPGLVVMQPGAPIPIFSRLPTDWGDDIADVPGVAVVNGEIWQRVNVIDGKTIISPPRFLFGIDIPSRVALRKCVYRNAMLADGPYAGRFLNESDRGTFNIVVSRQIAEEFEKEVGDTLQVNNREMTIVGVYHHGSLLVDVAIILDIDQVRSLTLFDPDSVCAFYVEQEEGADVEEVAERIRGVFRGREVERWKPASAIQFAPASSGNPLIDFLRRLDQGLKSPQPSPTDDSQEEKNTPASDGDGGPKSESESEVIDSRVETLPGQSFASIQDEGATSAEAGEGDDSDLPIEVRSASDWADRFDEFAGDLDIILGVLTAIGVTIAVLSIVNTMLMSVTERIIEFGILKANGWSKYDVLKLITIESAVLGFAGGVLGSLFGRIAADVVNLMWPARAHLYASPGLLLFGVVFATVLGIAGGLYPAFWAMRMMPMDAIRRG